MAIVLSNAVMTADNGSTGMPILLFPYYTNLADTITYNNFLSSSNFNMDDNGRLQYTGSVELSCFVSARFSLLREEGVTLRAAIYKNGIQITSSIITDPASPTILNYPVSLVDQDYLELWANIESGSNVSLVQAQMSIIGPELS
jgi:hypothetical protein